MRRDGANLACFALYRTVVQPTLERAGDPDLTTQFSSYVSKASTIIGQTARVGGGVLASGLQVGSTVIKRDLGYDVGDLGSSYLERATGRGAGQGYNQVGSFHAPSAEAQEEGNNFFGEHMGAADSLPPRQAYANQPGLASPGGSSRGGSPAAVGEGYGQDTWATLAPQSAGRAPVVTAAAGGSRGSSGRSSPAVNKPAKKDDWDDFGGEWKND